MLHLSRLTRDEAEFAERCLTRNWPNSAAFVCLLEKLNDRLEVAEHDLAAVRDAMGDRWRPGVSLSQLVLEIRLTH